ncbi:PEP-CTERM sorting domain-containing protein [Planctomycetota bacterium]|nr:PEP-CTERM sorting domain-containing protein [Planctomycetota bacterium]
MISQLQATEGIAVDVSQVMKDELLDLSLGVEPAAVEPLMLNPIDTKPKDDTISFVPEPGSLVLILLGTLAIMRPKK